VQYPKGRYWDCLFNIFISGLDDLTTCTLWRSVDGSTSGGVVDMQYGQTARDERIFRCRPKKAARSAKLCSWGGVTLCISAGWELTG